MYIKVLERTLLCSGEENIKSNNCNTVSATMVPWENRGGSANLGIRESRAQEEAESGCLWDREGIDGWEEEAGSSRGVNLNTGRGSMAP